MFPVYEGESEHRMTQFFSELTKNKGRHLWQCACGLYLIEDDTFHLLIDFDRASDQKRRNQQVIRSLGYGYHDESVEESRPNVLDAFSTALYEANRESDITRVSALMKEISADAWLSLGRFITRKGARVLHWVLDLLPDSPFTLLNVYAEEDYEFLAAAIHPEIAQALFGPLRTEFLMVCAAFNHTVARAIDSMLQDHRTAKEEEQAAREAEAEARREARKQAKAALRAQKQAKAARQHTSRVQAIEAQQEARKRAAAEREAERSAAEQRQQESRELLLLVLEPPAYLRQEVDWWLDHLLRSEHPVRVSPLRQEAIEWLQDKGAVIERKGAFKLTREYAL